MNATVALIGFIIYSLGIYCVPNLWVLGSLLAVQCLILLVQTRHFNWRKLVWSILFLAFIFVCNLIYCDLLDALLITIRLALSLSAIFIILQTFAIWELSRGIANLFWPLKHFGANIEDIYLSTLIAFNILPLLFREAKITELSLKTRGAGVRVLLTRPTVFINTYLQNVFARTRAIERSLRLKGYE